MSFDKSFRFFRLAIDIKVENLRGGGGARSVVVSRLTVGVVSVDEMLLRGVYDAQRAASRALLLSAADQRAKRLGHRHPPARVHLTAVLHHSPLIPTRPPSIFVNTDTRLIGLKRVFDFSAQFFKTDQRKKKNAPS
jgi:hypothetical protein